jgi:hypothetical protein
VDGCGKSSENGWEISIESVQVSSKTGMLREDELELELINIRRLSSLSD